MGISIRDPEVGAARARTRQAAQDQYDRGDRSCAAQRTRARARQAAVGGAARGAGRRNHRDGSAGRTCHDEGRNRRVMGSVIFVDTSVFVAILSKESDRRDFSKAIEAAEHQAHLAVVRLETCIVLGDPTEAFATGSGEAVRETSPQRRHRGDAHRLCRGRRGCRMLRTIRKGPTSCAAQLCRLSLLRLRESAWRGAAVQGRGFRAN